MSSINNSNNAYCLQENNIKYGKHNWISRAADRHRREVVHGCDWSLRFAAQMKEEKKQVCKEVILQNALPEGVYLHWQDDYLSA